MADASFEDVLSKLTFSPVDSKDFLTLLFQTDEKGFDYLSGLKKQFKEKYVIPTFKKAQNVYEKIGKNLTESEKQENLKLIGDPFDIISLNKEYKEKVKKAFEDKLKDLKTSVNATKSEVQNTLKSSPLGSVIPDQAKAPKEQATFTEKVPKITLSDESIEDLKELLNLNLKNLNLANKVEVTKEEQKSGLLDTLGKLLLAGGVAGVLIAAFWDKIKPWLEEKFNFNLDFLDKFEGTLEGISKFFTLGGLKVTAGPLFTLVGKAFTTVGELIEGGLKAIFQLGFGDDVVKQGAQAAPAVWKTLLPKIAGGLFKGAGLVALKAIPLIGSLISFYFAYDRFNKGDIIGGLIDVAGGITNLIPGAGIPLSLGLAALNAFIDYKTGDLPDDQKQSAKLDIIGGLSNKVYDMLKDVPLIGGLFKFGLGIYEIASGNFAKGLDYLVEQPFLGPLPALLKAITNSTEEQADGDKTFSFDKFREEIRKNIFKFAKSLIPDWFGLHGKLAKWMGLDYNSTSGEITEAELNVDSINQAQQEMQKLASQKFEGMNPQMAATAHKQTKNELLKLEEEYKNSWSNMSVFGTNVGSLFNTEMQRKIEAKRQEMMEINKKIKEADGDDNGEFTAMGPEESLEQYDRAKEKFDGLIRAVSDQYKEKKPPIKIPAPENESPLIFDKLKNLESSPDLLNLRSDANLDQGIKQLTGIVESVNKGIFKMTGDLANSLTKQLSLAGGGGMTLVGSQGGSNKNDIIFSGSRDSIYELRSSWWRKTSNLREGV